MHLDPTEVLGFLTGVACVYLGARQNVWNWPIGIANNIAFLVIFWRSKLYADSGLQIFYLAIAFYGWWCWLYAGKDRTNLLVSRTSPRLKFILAFLTVAAAAILYFVLHRYTDSNVPLGDAITTALSLTAQFMMGRKMLENWLVWIVADVLYIGLYCYKSLYLTAFLYTIFIVLCVAGYRQWKGSMEESASEPEAAEA